MGKTATRKRATIKMDAEVHRQLRDYCRETGRIVEITVNIAISQYLRSARKRKERTLS